MGNHELTASMQLGPFEILGLAGAGGMGEVYRARDTRLGRTVALKLLTSADGDDSQQRVRLEREARAIAALNHPNICAIHDVGRHDGRDYLVMEYVEGETLEHRLQRGPLTWSESWHAATGIAGALDAAHRQGSSPDAEARRPLEGDRDKVVLVTGAKEIADISVSPVRR